MQRALRERRERADRFDLVAEELDPERLAAGGRKDVDDAAAHGEMAALLDALDPLVAGQRELLGERRARHVADASGSARAAHAGGGIASASAAAEAHDEPAGGEDVERPGALADEVRRRLEPRAPVDAAARQQRDPFVAEEPAGRLGGVAGIGVLGKQADERALELLCERREDRSGERGLGDAARGRQRSAASTASPRRVSPSSSRNARNRSLAATSCVRV